MFAVPSLRVPRNVDLVSQLSRWLDEAHQDGQNRRLPEFTSAACQPALQRLDELRRDVRHLLMDCYDHRRELQQAQKHAEDEEIMDADGLGMLQDYAAALEECLEHGFPGSDQDGTANSAPLFLPWSSSSAAATGRLRREDGTDDDDVHPDDEGGNDNGGRRQRRRHDHHNLAWEHANVLWNMAALYVKHASSVVDKCVGPAAAASQQQQSRQAALTKKAWTEGSTLLRSAAKLVMYIRTEVLAGENAVSVGGGGGGGIEDDEELSSDALMAWEKQILADIQRASYQAFASGARPQPMMLAKLAVASVPLYQNAEESLMQICGDADDEGGGSGCAMARGMRSTVRAWMMWMSAMSEYHQAMAHKTRKEADLAMARLERATRYGQQCQDFCHDCLRRGGGGPDDVGEEGGGFDGYGNIRGVQDQMESMLEQMEQQWQESLEATGDNQVRVDDLPEIPPQRMINANSCTKPEMDKILHSPQSFPPLRRQRERQEGEDRQPPAPLFANLAVGDAAPAPAATAQHNSRMGNREGEEEYDSRYSDEDARDYGPRASSKDAEEYGSRTSSKDAQEYGSRASSKDAQEYGPRSGSKDAQEYGPRISSKEAEEYNARLRREVEEKLEELSNTAEEKTESARRALATVNLPHSLTAYKQARRGGGIPDELWQRVETIQRDDTIRQLKRELWGLRDIAELAKGTYERVHKILDDDLAMDSMFREHHPPFNGNDVQEVQRPFRQTLSNYAGLMASAQDGDTLVLQRLEMLDTDPKYKLLQYRKSQLDRLLPGSRDGDGDIDVTALSGMLVELSSLFQNRDGMIQEARERLELLDIHDKIMDAGGAGAENIYRSAMESFDGMFREIHSNIEQQGVLLHKILDENEYFMHERHARETNSDGDKSIVMIEEAIEDVEALSKHLKDGRAFYDVVEPKLQKLKQQVDNLSARLTADRCEFEDKAQRGRPGPGLHPPHVGLPHMGVGVGVGQPVGGGPYRPPGSYPPMQGRYGGPGPSYPGQEPPYPPSFPDGRGGPDPARHPRQQNPGVQEVPHNMPVVHVDDAKVANLVGMDFDPDKVVAALKKYDNNLDMALNDLLS